jgi:LysM repeat protein
MRRWTKSACMAVAWLALPLLAAASLLGASQLIQATASTANSSSSSISSTRTITSSASTHTAPATRPAVLTAVIRTAAPAARTARAPARPVTWTVRPGNTLSGIAAALGVKGGWQALYAANRTRVGPDPDAIRPGSVLAVPGTGSTARYTVATGDTLTGIAAALGVKGGWQALYQANRHEVGPDADTLRVGTILTLPHTTAPARTPAAPGAGGGKAPSSTKTQPQPAPPGTSTAPAGIAAPGNSSSVPAGGTAPAAGRTPSGPESGTSSSSAGIMPRWLEATLLAAALLTILAFLAEPAVVLTRRRRTANAAPARASAAGRAAEPAPAANAADHAAQIIEAAHERLIVTYSVADHTIYLLTPPGEDPRAVLRAARLVVPEPAYQDLAGHLGVPPGWSEGGGAD